MKNGISNNQQIKHKHLTNEIENGKKIIPCLLPTIFLFFTGIKGAGHHGEPNPPTAIELSIKNSKQLRNSKAKIEEADWLFYTRQKISNCLILKLVDPICV